MPLMLVGDTDQCLFRFQGAKPEIITEEIQRYIPDIGTIKLAVNYRSHDEIINAASRLISHNYSDLGGPYSQEFMKDTRGIKGSGGYIGFQMYFDAEAEAQAAMDTIQELFCQGYLPGDFFIGSRTRAQLAYVESALVKSGIKFLSTIGGSFWTSKHVADVVAYLKLAHNTNDGEALKRIYNIPSASHSYTWNDKEGKFQVGDYCHTRYLGQEFLAKTGNNFNNIDKIFSSSDAWRYKTKPSDYEKYGATKAQDLQEFVWAVRDALRDVENMGQVIQFIVDNCYEKYLKHEGASDEGLVTAKLDDLATVQELASKYSQADAFLGYVAEMEKAAIDKENKDWSEYVVISTYHRLKGLERKVIFGLGWCEGIDTKTEEPRGLLPHTFSMVPPPQFGILPSNGMSLMEDERCIAFVAITRAAEKVYLSGIKTYRTWILEPSRFIKEIGGI
jgi:DNA helicase-2/ATP-dependent DNA helicase PcrA